MKSLNETVESNRCQSLQRTEKEFFPHRILRKNIFSTLSFCKKNFSGRSYRFGKTVSEKNQIKDSGHVVAGRFHQRGSQTIRKLSQMQQPCISIEWGGLCLHLEGKNRGKDQLLSRAQFLKLDSRGSKIKPYAIVQNWRKVKGQGI